LELGLLRRKDEWETGGARSDRPATIL